MSWGLGDDDAVDTHVLKNLVAALLPARARKATVTEMQLLAALRQQCRGSLATLCCLLAVSCSVEGAAFSGFNIGLTLF